MFLLLKVYACFSLDSPGVPASANAHQLFRGFSFVAKSLGQEQSIAETRSNSVNPIVQVSGICLKRTEYTVVKNMAIVFSFFNKRGNCCSFAVMLELLL